MRAVADQDHAVLERWAGMAEADTSVVQDVHLGGIPVCLLGVESRSVARRGFPPADGPDTYTSGTLFPQSSKKAARAINAASGNRPLVVLANLSGFDGSPESLRKLQLEYGAEIGRAIVNFDGPIVFCVISRSSAAPPRPRSSSPPTSTPARPTPRASANSKPGWPCRPAPTAELDETRATVRTEKLTEVATEFDRVHNIQRAVEVGSVDAVIGAAELRPRIIEAIEARLG